MLSAQKTLLEASVAAQGAGMQGQEMVYFSNNFSMLSTLAAVIGGFAFSGLIVAPTYADTEFLGGKKHWIVNLYYVCASVAIGSCMLCCVISTIVSVRCQGLALRGPDGSLSKAVLTLRIEQRRALFSLCVGVVAFHLEGMTYTWLMFHLESAVYVTSGIFTLFLLLMLGFTISIFKNTHIETGLESGLLGEGQFDAVYNRLAGTGAGAGAYGGGGTTAGGKQESKQQRRANRKNRQDAASSDEDEEPPAVERSVTGIFNSFFSRPDVAPSDDPSGSARAFLKNDASGAPV